MKYIKEKITELTIWLTEMVISIQNYMNRKK